MKVNNLKDKYYLLQINKQKITLGNLAEEIFIFIF